MDVGENSIGSAEVLKYSVLAMFKVMSIPFLPNSDVCSELQQVGVEAILSSKLAQPVCYSVISPVDLQPNKVWSG